MLPRQSDPVAQTCDHNPIPCRGGVRHLFRAGWICVRCHEWARRLTDLPRLCPDCKLGPDQGPDGECYWCRVSWEQQQRDREIYGGGYEDGWRGAEEAHDVI